MNLKERNQSWARRKSKKFKGMEKEIFSLLDESEKRGYDRAITILLLTGQNDWCWPAADVVAKSLLMDR